METSQFLGIKKRRLYGACDHCRDRKIKCDSSEKPDNKCSNCVAYSTDCTHVAARSRKNGGVPQKLATSSDIGDIQTHIAAILSETAPYSTPKNPGVVQALLRGLAHYARELESKLTTQLETMEEPMADLSLSEDRHRRYGAANDAKFIESAFDLKNKLNPTHSLRRRQFWTPPTWQSVPRPLLPPLIFPSSDLLDDLVTLYLDMTNVSMSIIHGPTFRRNIAQGLHFESRQFGSVVLAVCALSARSSTDHRISDDHRAGWEWYSQIRPFDPTSSHASPPTLWDLQLFPLMILYIYGQSVADECWLYAGMGVRLAQDMGAHRLKRGTGSWSTHDESLNRAWWAVVTMDAYVSSLFGRARCTNSDQFDSDYPLEVDDDCWPGELLADPIDHWKQPAGVPAKVTAWVLFLRLMDIYSFAQQTIYSVRRAEFWDSLSTVEWDHNVAVVLDSALNKWLEAIPDHLRWDPHLPSDSSALLYSTFYWVQIQVHRPFIRVKSSISSIVICANAARACSHVLQVHHREFGGVPLPSMLASILHSSIVLLLNAADGTFSTPRDLDDVRQSLEILAEHEGRWQVAGRYYDVIREVFELLSKKSVESEETHKRKAGDSDLRLEQATLDLDAFVGGGPGETFDWEYLDGRPWQEFLTNVFDY